MTLVKSDPKAPFLIATTPRCRGGGTAFLWLLHFTLDPYLITLSVKQGGIKHNFFLVFGMTRREIEPRRNLDGLVGRLDIWFPWCNLPPCVWVLFAALYTCLMFSATFPLVSIFLPFEVPYGCCDILFKPLETITDFHFLRNMGLMKYQDVGVGLDLLSDVSYRNSSDICLPLFSQGFYHLLHCSQGQLPTSVFQLPDFQLPYSQFSKTPLVFRRDMFFFSSCGESSS